MLTFDHFIWGVPNLQEGMAYFEQLTGVRPVIGGSHPGRGTKNALVSFGDGTYLELMGPDPEQDSFAPARDRLPEIIASLDAPSLLTVILRSNDLDALAVKAEKAGIEFHGPEAVSRQQPNGDVLSWRLGFTFDTGYGLLAPVYIDWQDCVHPSSTAPGGIELLNIEMHHPEADALRRFYQALGVELTVRKADRPGLQALIKAGDEEIVLSSHLHNRYFS